MTLSDPQDTPPPASAEVADAPPPAHHLHLHLHQEFFILGLSLIVLAMMVFELVAKPAAEVVALLRLLDNIACFFFLGDFVQRFRRAPDKWKFMRWGWIDLISSLPFLDSLRWGRAARVVRILRLLRAFRSLRWVIAHLFRDRSKGAVMSAALITLLVMFGGALSILTLEGAEPSANIKSPGDALWWTIVTITTVGYGDHYPVTWAGRIVGAVLMITGICLLAVITGSVASIFVNYSPPEPDAPGAGDTPAHRLSLEDLLAEMREMRQEICTLNLHVSTLQEKLPNGEHAAPPARTDIAEGKETPPHGQPNDPIQRPAPKS